MSNKVEYPDFNEWVWRGFTKATVRDIDEFVKMNYERGRDFHVGSDSQVHGNKTTFVTALIAHNKNYGGEVIIHKTNIPNYSSKEDLRLRQRLLMEAMMTIETAWHLDQVLPKDANIRIHVDVNNAVQFKSGQYKEELVGMIMGQGYISYREIEDAGEEQKDYPRVVLWKPDSWAAMKVADKKT